MANIYIRSGCSDFKHKEVEDISKAWKESYSSSYGEEGKGC
jgi:hypothetical protein